MEKGNELKSQHEMKTFLLMRFSHVFNFSNSFENFIKIINVIIIMGGSVVEVQLHTEMVISHLMIMSALHHDNRHVFN